MGDATLRQFCGHDHNYSRKVVNFMKRYVALLIFLGLVLSLLSACTESPNSTRSASSGEESSVASGNTAQSDVEPGVEPVFYMSKEPLPPEITEGGTGDGNLKKKDYFCKVFKELHGFLPQLPTKGPEKVTSLPVYKNKYPLGQVRVTEEMKADLENKAKEFLIQAGRTDLVEAGLSPDEYALNESEIPAYVCQFDDFRIRSHPSGITIATEISDLNDAPENEVRALLNENKLLSAACKIAGINDPVLTFKKDYDYYGNARSNLYLIYQKGKDEKDTFLNKTFSSVTIMTQYESDAVVVGINTDDVIEYIGDYSLLPYNKALNTLRKECGVKNKEVLGYEIEYTQRLNQDYFIPYYKFYFIAPDKKEIAETTELEVFSEYYIRAVLDVDDTASISSGNTDGELPSNDALVSPLPPEDIEHGSGDGEGRWLAISHLCKSYEEFRELKVDLQADGINVETLPVFAEKKYEVSAELKAEFQKEAEDFLEAAGRYDLVENGLTPDEEALNDDENPAFDCQFSDFSIRIMDTRITVAMDLPGIREASESDLILLLNDNPILSAACGQAGITTPAFNSEKDYDYNGNEFMKMIYIYQRDKEVEKGIINKTFASMFISTTYGSDTVVISIAKPDIATNVGNYAFVPYEEALAALSERFDVQPDQVIDYDVEYLNTVSAGYYVPYYKFYVEEAGETAKEKADLESLGLHIYREYKIRAVKN